MMFPLWPAVCKQLSQPHAWLAAPEILKGGSDYNSACDVWSLGCILYVMVVGDYPFLCESERLDDKAQFKRTQDRCPPACSALFCFQYQHGEI